VDPVYKPHADVLKRVLIYGSREFGQTVRALVEDCGAQFAGFIDDWHSGPTIIGSFVDAQAGFNRDGHDVAIAIGYKNLEARWKVYQSVIAAGYRVPALVHPDARVNRRATVSGGAMVMAGAVIDTNATVGSLAVVRPGAVVSHDTRIGENTYVAPNATICGSCNVGRNCFIGAGAVVVDHAHVPDGAFVKAGSVYKQQ
jgi:sugar O-acyltransferase (sialic acid O-acetyltransferase NeuD family)